MITLAWREVLLIVELPFLYFSFCFYVLLDS